MGRRRRQGRGRGDRIGRRRGHDGRCCRWAGERGRGRIGDGRLLGHRGSGQRPGAGDRGFLRGPSGGGHEGGGGGGAVESGEHPLVGVDDARTREVKGDLEPLHRVGIGIDVDPHRFKAGRQEGDSLVGGEERLVVIDARFEPTGDEQNEHRTAADLRGGLGLREIGVPGDRGGGGRWQAHHRHHGAGPDDGVERREKPSVDAGCHRTLPRGGVTPSGGRCRSSSRTCRGQGLRCPPSTWSTAGAARGLLPAGADRIRRCGALTTFRYRSFRSEKWCRFSGLHRHGRRRPPQTAPIPRVGPPAGRAILKSGPKEAPEGGAMDGGLTSSAGVLILSPIGCEPGFPRSARFFGGWGKGSQGWSLSGGSRGIRRGWLGGGYGQPFGPFPYVSSRFLPLP